MRLDRLHGLQRFEHEIIFPLFDFFPGIDDSAQSAGLEENVDYKGREEDDRDRNQRTGNHRNHDGENRNLFDRINVL